MADIIRLRGSPHEQTQLLLPWYTNNSLDPDELELVEAHLAECAECRAEADAECRLARNISQIAFETDPAPFPIDIERDNLPAKHSVVPLFQRRISLGWMIAGQAAALAAGIYLANVPLSSDRTYHALGAAPATESGNIVIVFKPEASEQEMRSVLLQSDARVVDGPNASGAYVLRVPQIGRQRALDRLRRMPQVMLAEPIDAGSPT